MSRVLLVENDPALSDIIGSILASSGHEVVRAAAAGPALKALDSGPFAAAFLDLQLNDGTQGDEVYRAIRNRTDGGRTPVVICTVQRENTLRRRIGRPVSEDPNLNVLYKPFSLVELQRLIVSLLSERASLVAGVRQ